MTWFKVDDRLPDHRKVRRLGKDKAAGVGVWTLAGAWASGNGTDGFVPAEVVQQWDPRERLAGRLVEVQLWRTVELEGERGYQFHDWPDWNPTRAEIEAERAATRERVRKHRAQQRSNGVTHAERNGVSNADVPDPGPSRPVPARPDLPPVTSGGDTQAAYGEINKPPRPPSPCGFHPDDNRPCRRCRDTHLATPTTRPSTTDEGVAAAVALGAALDAEATHRHLRAIGD